MKQIRLGVISPDINDATSMYRAGGPLSSLHNHIDVKIDYLKTATNMSLLHNDVIFMQRPFLPDHLGAAKMVKRLKLPLWCDFDDFMFDIPKDNPGYRQYSSKEVQSSVFEIMQLADVVSVTTEFMKDKYTELAIINGKERPLCKNVVVVPNAYDPRFHGIPSKPSGNKLISWRGSKSHEKDLMVFKEPILQFLNANKDWKIEFVGGVPWHFEESFDKAQATFTEPMDWFFYMEHMRKIAPSIHIVPLYDSVFNRCRSNISWIEATCFGAVTICPNWGGWTHPGTIGYFDVDDLSRALSKADTWREGAKDFTEASFYEINKRFHIDQSNEKRAEIIEGLI